MSVKKKILIIEDEPDLVGTLEYHFKREGYEILTAMTGQEGIKLALNSSSPDLVLLDLMLPDISGLEVCRRLRGNKSTKETPIVMLTAKGEELDRVVGFEVGADDYVVKPFSIRELGLRVRAVLRRSRNKSAEESVESDITAGLLRLDVAGYRVWIKDEEITLTALEFKLLLTMLKRKGRAQSRERLLTDVWGYQSGITTRTVDTHVKRLRNKLGLAASYIETLRGVGYRFKSTFDEE